MKRKLRSTFRSLRRNKSAGVSLGLVAAAFGLMLLLHGGDSATAAPMPTGVKNTPTTTVSTGRVPIHGNGVSGSFGLSHTKVLQNGTRRVLAELDLRADNDTTQPIQPMAISIVVDTSGSMSGNKIVQAKNAISQIASKLKAGDQLSIVRYEDAASIALPLRDVSGDRGYVQGVIAMLQPGGGTNIPAGVYAGIQQLRSAKAGHIRRLILLSDGIDGSGQTIAQLRDTLRPEVLRNELTISSLGIGTDYDEAFLSGVADAGRGNYVALTEGTQLAAFLNKEIDMAGRTLLRQVSWSLAVPNAFRIAQISGAEMEQVQRAHPAKGNAGEIHRVVIPVGAMSSNERRRIVVAFDVAAGFPQEMPEVAGHVSYRKNDVPEMTNRAATAFHVVANQAEVDQSIEPVVFAATTATLVDESQAKAIALWREGKVKQAQQVAIGNAQALQKVRRHADSKELRAQQAEYAMEADSFANTAAASSHGKKLGLDSNAKRHSRARKSSWGL